VFVGMIFVFTGVGVSNPGAFAQETRTSNRRELRTRFIRFTVISRSKPIKAIPL
jgi:hypothetical protein